MELWADVRGYEGLYEVSNAGNVRRDGKVLKPYARKRDGYMVLTLSKNGVQRSVRVHRIVAEAFVPNPENLFEINHKDEDRGNNAASNLEWCTHKANCNHGTRSRKIAQKLSRAVVQSLDGEIVKVWGGAQEAGRAGYTRCSVIQCCNGKARSHKGYQWQWK